MKTMADNRMQRPLRALVLLFLILSTATYAHAAGKQPDTVSSVLGDKALNGAKVAFVAWDLESGQSLYEQNIDTQMIPASNMKLITAAAALLRMGSEYQFSTTFMVSSWSNGAAQDLLVASNGDPTLSEEFFDTAGAGMDAFAANLYSRGLRSVSGNLVLDTRAFAGPDYPDGWIKEDMYYCYGMKTGALSVAENCLNVTVTGGAKAGAPPTLTSDPPLYSKYVKLNVKTVSKGKSSIKVSQASDGIITISGQVKTNTPAGYELPVPYPDMLYGSALAAAMVKRGISFQGNLVRVQNWSGGNVPWHTLSTIGSPYITRIIAVMLKNSDNYIAETLVRAMGHEFGGEGSTKAGVRVVQDVLNKNNIASPGTLTQYDGSGLSRKNRLSPRVLMQLLRTFYNSYLGPALMQSMAEPGKEGTLKKRLNGTPAEGNVWAKTGALSGACSLSGYFIRPNGHVGAFSMIMNGYSVHSNAIRSLQDRLVLVMMGM